MSIYITSDIKKSDIIFYMSFRAIQCSLVCINNPMSQGVSGYITDAPRPQWQFLACALRSQILAIFYQFKLKTNKSALITQNTN